MKRFEFRRPAAALLLAAAPLLALAQAAPTAATPAAPAMSMAQVLEHLAGQGRDIAVDGRASACEVKRSMPGPARGAAGRFRSGEVLKTEFKHRGPRGWPAAGDDCRPARWAGRWGPVVDRRRWPSPP